MRRAEAAALSAVLDRLGISLFIGELGDPGDDASLVLTAANDAARRMRPPDANVAAVVGRAIRRGEPTEITAPAPYSGWAFPLDAACAAVAVDHFAERRVLAQSVDFHMQLLAAVEQVVLATDLEGRVIYCNDFVETTTGYSREDVIGGHVLELVAPGSLERTRQLLDSVLRGESWSGEVMGQRKDGSEFRAFATVSPLHRDGETVGTVGVAMDMSPFDEPQEAVRTLAARQHALLRAVPDRILALRRDGTFVDFRRAAPLADTFPGTNNIADVVPPAAAEELRSAVGRAFAAGRVETVEYEVGEDDGRRVFEARVAPIDGEEVVAVIRDITERRRQRELLARAYAELEQRVSERTMELAQVNAELRAANERLQSLSRRLLAVQEEERRHIGRELHDQIGQMLTALKLTLESLQRPGTSMEQVTAEADRLIDELFGATSGLSLELRPPMLDDGGLLPALLWHVERYQQQTRIPVEVRHTELPRLSGEVETAAFRMAQEALTNVARHSGASSARVLVWLANELLMMQIEDDGAGFDVDAAWQQPSGGLSGMRERATLLGGRLTVDSSPGHRTTISVELPAHPRRT